MTGKEALRRLKKEGWMLVRVRGSHHALIKGQKRVSVPVHGNKELREGTYQDIAKKAGWLK